MGDGESAEGSIWEAMSFASHYDLDNLVAIFDINRLGQSEATPLQHQMDVYKARCEAFGFHTIAVDGHDVEALCKVFHEASEIKGKPTAVLLKTLKGKGLDGIEDQENWHGKPLGDKAPEALQTLRTRIVNGSVSLKPELPVDDAPKVDISNIKLSSPPAYEVGEKVSNFSRHESAALGRISNEVPHIFLDRASPIVRCGATLFHFHFKLQIATRLAYGTALAKLGAGNDRVIALDGDTKNSTYSDKFKKAHPDR